MNKQVLAQEIGAEAVAHIMHTLIEVRGISYTRVLDFINNDKTHGYDCRNTLNDNGVLTAMLHDDGAEGFINLLERWINESVEVQS